MASSATATSSATALILPSQQSMAAWYMPLQSDGDTSEDLVRTAYEQALAFHKAEFKSTDSTSWLSKTSSMADVLDVLAKARQKHEMVRANRSKALSVPISWWKIASSKIMQYEKVVETISSAYPEYTAILWGAMKFLFTVTLNYQEMSSKIARSFAEIGAVLPEMDFITQKLYPVKSIQQTLGNIYVQIMKFCTRATRWYNYVSRNPIKKILGSILKTWPLEFEDIRLNIDTCVRRLREQSALAHQAETRDVHVKLSDIHAIYASGFHMQTAHGSDETASVRLVPSAIEEMPFTKEDVLPYLSDIQFNPNHALEVGTLMRDRRRSRNVSSQFWTSNLDELRGWLSGNASSVLLLQGSRRNSEDPRDIAVDLILLLKSEKVPVVWYLGTTSTSPTTPITAIDMLRSWIQQVIDQCPDKFTQSRLNQAQFESCRSFADWLRLFITVLGHLPVIALLIDAHAGACGVLETLNQLWTLIAEQDCTISTVIKVMVLTYDDVDNSSLAFGPMATVAYKIVIMNARAPSRSGGNSPRAARQKRTSSRYNQNEEFENLRPLVRQLTSSSTDLVILPQNS